MKNILATLALASVLASPALAQDTPPASLLNYQWSFSGEQYALAQYKLHDWDLTKPLARGFAADVNFLGGFNRADDLAIPSFGLELALSYTSPEGLFVKVGPFAVIRQEQKFDGGFWFGAGWKF